MSIMIIINIFVITKCVEITIIFLKNTMYPVYSVAAVLYLQLVLHVMLLRPRNMFCTFTLAHSAVCVQCPLWLYCVVP